jgi:hypothetical protein
LVLRAYGEPIQLQHILLQAYPYSYGLTLTPRLLCNFVKKLLKFQLTRGSCSVVRSSSGQE